MTDAAAQWIWGIAALILVGSSLIARQLPIGRTLKMATAWIAIFIVFFVLFLFRDEGRAIWDRARADVSADRGETVGGTFKLRKEEDGHFHVEALVNGTRVRFLIDSGATTTTLTPQSAAAARVVPSGGFPVAVDTANGVTTARRATAKTLTVGPITQHDASILIGSDALGDTNLLGMSFLSSLKSWRVEGAHLILEAE